MHAVWLFDSGDKVRLTMDITTNDLIIVPCNDFTGDYWLYRLPSVTATINQSKRIRRIPKWIVNIYRKREMLYSRGFSSNLIIDKCAVFG